MILPDSSFAAIMAPPIRIRTVKAALLAALCLSPVTAQSVLQTTNSAVAKSGRELPPYLQCVPYAREQSGVQIYGDAHTWWGQAQGRYKRGRTPKVGAVMAFRPHRNMRLGHVAAVSRIVDSRTVLLSHSNWSPINGRRGQIERNVKAIDVSPNNDWSSVRVWYHPLQGLGKTAWPIHGFIYNQRSDGRAAPVRVARSAPARVEPARTTPSPAFASAFGSLGVPRAPAARAPATQTGPQYFAAGPRTQRARPQTSAAAPQQARQRPPQRAAARPADPVAAALSRYE